MSESLKSGRFRGGEIRVPGSKSLTQRALLIAALAEGDSVIEGALECDDRRYLETILAALGVPISSSAARIDVRGRGGHFDTAKETLYVGNAGTALRFLTPALFLGEGTYVLDGNDRMRSRPVADLVDALAGLGAEAEYLRETGFPPLKIHARGLAGGRVKMRGDVSSQFLSGLLIAAPYAQKPVEILLDGDLVSRPYVEMTRAVMKRFGVQSGRIGDSLYAPGMGPYQATRFLVEPDASSASYWLALAAIHRVSVTIPGLNSDSLQGDTLFAIDLARMGTTEVFDQRGLTIIGEGPLHGGIYDLGDRPDVAPTLAVTALFADDPTRIENIAHLRHKESDRIAVLAAGLRALGAEVVEEPDALEIVPTADLHPADLQVHGDHRMAMAFALAATKIPGITIDDKACVTKSYPDFFTELDARLD